MATGWTADDAASQAFDGAGFTCAQMRIDVALAAASGEQRAEQAFGTAQTMDGNAPPKSRIHRSGGGN